MDRTSPRKFQVAVWVQARAGRYLALEWHDPNTGKRRNESTGTHDPEAAETLRADREYEINHGLHREPCKLAWDAFLERFRAEKLPQLRPRSREKIDTVLTVLHDLMGKSIDRLADLNEQTLSQFAAKLRARENAAWTIRNYLGAVRSILGWAVEQRMIDQCPRIPTIKVPRRKPQSVSAESVERLMDACKDDAWRAFFACGWYAGLRLSEASELRRKFSKKHPYVDWQTDRIVIPADFAKADEDQWVPMHPALRVALRELKGNEDRFFSFRSRKGGKLLTRPGLSHAVGCIAKRAGVRVTMHSLRRGFGARLATKVPAQVLQQLMRHANIATTMSFYANVDRGLKDAVALLD